jgi:putative SOS response-associated peptidase YedK
MCGRYASARSVDDLASTFGITTDDVDAAAAPDWNVAPTKPVTAVLVRDGRRTLTTLRWGLVPSWASDPSVGARMINARLETAAEKPAFRDALVARRCLLPADGWYEWQARPDGSRQPHFLAPPDGQVIALAGLWEVWWDAEGRPLRSATIVTGPAPDDLASIHDRAPMVVPQATWHAWLDPDMTEGARLLEATPVGVVVPRPVGDAVGDVRSNGPQLVEPVQVAEQPPLF